MTARQREPLAGGVSRAALPPSMPSSTASPSADAAPARVCPLNRITCRARCQDSGSVSCAASGIVCREQRRPDAGAEHAVHEGLSALNRVIRRRGPATVRKPTRPGTMTSAAVTTRPSCTAVGYPGSHQRVQHPATGLPTADRSPVISGDGQEEARATQMCRSLCRQCEPSGKRPD